MKRLVISGFVCLALVALCASPAWAQRGGGRRGGGGGFGRGPMNAYMLLSFNNEQLLTELKITPEQKDKLKTIRDESMSQFGGGGGGGGGGRPTEEERKKRREEMQARMLETRKKIDAVLTPEQLERVKGINLQLGGASALTSEDVAKDLKLSNEQVAQLKTIVDETDKKRRELPRAGRDATDAERAASREKATQLQKDADEEALAVLTADQKAQLEKIKGAKFEVDMSKMQFGGGGNRRGGRRGGDGAEKKSDDKKADEKKEEKTEEKK